MKILGGYSVKDYFQLYRQRKDPDREGYWRAVNKQIVRRMQTWLTVIVIAGAGGGAIVMLSGGVADVTDKVVGQVKGDLDRLERADRVLRDTPPGDVDRLIDKAGSLTPEQREKLLKELDKPSKDK